MGENTLDNRGQWTGKRDCLAPRRGRYLVVDDANGGGDMTSNDVSCSNAMIFRCFGLILLVGLDFNTSIGGLVSRGLVLVYTETVYFFWCFYNNLYFTFIFTL